MAQVLFDFIPMGSVVKPARNKLYVDVGNNFCNGILDHHHSGAPDACATMLALQYGDMIKSQLIGDNPLTIITHLFPDLDAIGATWFARRQLESHTFNKIDKAIAEYVCGIDRGYTAIEANKPVSVYSLMATGLHRIYSTEDKPEIKSMLALEFGLVVLDKLKEIMESEEKLHDSEVLSSLNEFKAEVELIKSDRRVYLQDIQKANRFECNLPKKEDEGLLSVLGLSIIQPNSILFKSWARGEGFDFLVVNISSTRTVISVSPDCGVYLKGLGDLLEKAETKKREEIGKVRKGKKRPGYSSPDPWYDGRNAMHDFTIVDSPKSGTLLTFEEIYDCVKNFCAI